MKIQSAAFPGYKLLSFEKNCYLDNETEDYFSNAVSGQLAKGGAVLFDFRNLAYINSAGLSALLRIYNSCKESNCKLKIFGTQERIASFFKITKMDALFDVYPTLDDAAAALAAG